MSVTGPSGVVEDMMNIVVEGDMEGMGNDTFSAGVFRQRGYPGDLFVCMASNVVSNASHSFICLGFKLKTFDTLCLLI